MGRVSELLEKVFDPYSVEPITQLVKEALETLYEIKHKLVAGEISREELLRLL